MPKDIASRRRAAIAWAGHVGPPLALVALILSAAWEITLGGRIIARGDLLLYFYPLREFASASLREGQLPLWNPLLGSGAPLAVLDGVNSPLPALAPMGDAQRLVFADGLAFRDKRRIVMVPLQVVARHVGVNVEVRVGFPRIAADASMATDRTALSP